MLGFRAEHDGYNPFERKISAENVGSLAQAWTATLGPSLVPGNHSPVVARGVAYIGWSDGLFYAFDAEGQRNCSGTPKSCAPLWTATLAGPALATPAVQEGVAYVTGGGRLYAFDAAGTTNCTSTTPKTCEPLWTSVVGNFPTTIAGNGPPIVAWGRVYVAGNPMRVFDAKGRVGCTGVPTICQPLWQTDRPHPGSAAVSGDFVYVDEGANPRLLAYDVRGVIGCGGVPKTCTPIWTGDIFCGITTFCFWSSPAVADGNVLVSAAGTRGDGVTAGGVSVFDAAGQTNCTGASPRSCAPLRTYLNSGGSADLAIANGMLYVAALGVITTPSMPTMTVQAYPIDGVTGCTGTPPDCGPVWESTVLTGTVGPLSVANDVVYVKTSAASSPAELAAFDTDGCTTSPCSPLRSIAITGTDRSPPTITNGFVYIADADRLLAFTVPEFPA
jgi:outer membrane protein assembly factor BamB